MLFKLFYRNLLKRKRNNLFGIAGLSIGIAVALIIGWWALNEFNYDKFNRDYNRIYRIGTQVELNGENLKLGSVFGPLMNDVREEVPEVEDGVRCLLVAGRMDKEKMKIADQIYYVDNIAMADSNFFTFFDYPFLLGDPATCFNAPNNMVVSKDFAQKYFNTSNVLGKTIEIFGDTWEITAIMQNVPANSHLQFEAMCCLQGNDYWNNNDYGNNDAFLSYLKFPENANIQSLEERITKLSYDKFWHHIQADVHQILQPLAEIHFGEGYRFEQAETANKSVVTMVLFMALAILIIACVNFTNLFISTALLRARAIGVRKTNGANRSTLIMEFFAETSFHTLIALTIGLVMALAFLPFFNQLTGIQLAFDFAKPVFYLFMLGIALFTIILAGTFPAFYITKFNPVETLKGKLQGKGVSALQKSLVIIQYAASIVLLISVLTIKKQVQYFQEMDLGFTTSNIIYLNLNDNIAKSFEVIRNDLKANPNVRNVTLKNGGPHEWRQGQGVANAAVSTEEHVMEICRVEGNYFEFLGIDILQGESLEAYHDSLNYALINEKAAKILGLTDAVGKDIIINQNTYTVKGLVEDIKSKSLHELPDAQVYVKLGKPKGWHTLIIHTDGNNQPVIAALQTIWKQYSPDELFEYHFLDQTYEQMYTDDERTGKMASIGMIIALILTTLGLFALVKFSMQQRIKEIAVRKVNGATVSGLVMKLNKNFLIWIAISFAIAGPLAYFIMNRWLEGFAFRIHIGVSVFILGAFITSIIALSTVSWQTYAAASANPVKALKDE